MDLLAEIAKAEFRPHPDPWLINRLSDPFSRQHWEGVIQLLKNTYWKRLWIIQEIVVASQDEIKLLCGPNSVSLGLLRLVLSQNRRIVHAQSVPPLCHTVSYNLRKAAVAFASISNHKHHWKKQDSNNKLDMSLLRNLIRHHSPRCQDPRDKVYSLLGISTTTVREREFPVNYNVPASTVYWNVAKYIIQTSQRLDILLQCHGIVHNEQITMQSCSSWAPNWQYYKRKFHTIGIDVHHAEEWEASRSLSTIATFEDDERILKTRGFVVGEISKKSHQFRSTSSNPVEAAKSFRTWLKFAMSAKLYAVPGGCSDGTAALVEATAILYEAIVKTRLGELGRPSCQLDRFRSYCEKILYDPDLPEETEWPFSAVDDPVDTISERQRLCEIELSACQISKVSDNQATFPQSNEPNEIQITSDQKNIVSTIGLCPVYANRGNVVAVIRGCRYPIVLRKAEHGYMVTNSIYMHGFMKGEAVDRFPEVDIELI
jgi:hypothetical protein